MGYSLGFFVVWEFYIRESGNRVCKWVMGVAGAASAKNLFKIVEKPLFDVVNKARQAADMSPPPWGTGTAREARKLGWGQQTRKNACRPSDESFQPPTDERAVWWNFA